MPVHAAHRTLLWSLLLQHPAVRSALVSFLVQFSTVMSLLISQWATEYVHSAVRCHNWHLPWAICEDVAVWNFKVTPFSPPRLFVLWPHYLNYSWNITAHSVKFLALKRNNILKVNKVYFESWNMKIWVCCSFQIQNKNKTTRAGSLTRHTAFVRASFSSRFALR